MILYEIVYVGFILKWTVHDITFRTLLSSLKFIFFVSHFLGIIYYTKSKECILRENYKIHISVYYKQSFHLKS